MKIVEVLKYIVGASLAMLFIFVGVSMNTNYNRREIEDDNIRQAFFDNRMDMIKSTTICEVTYGYAATYMQMALEGEDEESTDYKLVKLILDNSKEMYQNFYELNDLIIPEMLAKVYEPAITFYPAMIKSYRLSNEFKMPEVAFNEDGDLDMKHIAIMNKNCTILYDTLTRITGIQ